MKKKSLLMSFLFLAAMFPGTGFGEITVVHAPGVGARAYGLANNFVALSNDQSGLYWNPAGLAFVPVREFQAAFDGLYQKVNSDFNGQGSFASLPHLRLVNIGYLHAFPATKGGLTIAGALENPYTFDDVRKFSGGYQSGGNDIHVSRNARNIGGLSYWTGGFGLQVAEGLGVGASLAFVTGSEEEHNVFVKDTNGVINNTRYTNDYDLKSSRTYMGYDIRLGLLYNFSKHFNVGLRFVLPQTVWFTENASETYPHTPSEPEYTSESTGKIFSSYSGAVGFSSVFPFMTISTEARARSAYSFAYPTEMIPEQSLASKTLVGAGIGLEMPVVKSTVLLRAGYSWDQFDTHPFARKYDDTQAIGWDPQGVEPTGDQHTATVGTAFIINSACLEISYGFTYWKLGTQDLLAETYNQHRFLTSLSFRF
jgi:hypothetical protein